jgi:hypothetical protein
MKQAWDSSCQKKYINIQPLTWLTESICISPPALDLTTIAAEIFLRTCRIDFDSSGFRVPGIRDGLDSLCLRQIMDALKSEITKIHPSITAKLWLRMKLIATSYTGFFHPGCGSPDWQHTLA